MPIHKNIGLIALLSTMMLAGGLLLVRPLFGQEAFSLNGDAVAIYNLAGEVEVVRGTGSNVVVEVLRGGSDGTQLDIEVGAVRGRETLRIIYPDDRVVYGGRGRGSSTVRVRDDGTFFNDRGGNKVQVSGRGRGLRAHADLRISVPAGINIEVYLAVGEALVSGLESDVSVSIGSGAVDVADVVGDVHVDTGSGSVEVRRIKGNVHADTGSGSVELESIDGSFLTADTGSGSVVGRGITVDEVSVDTGSGRIRLEELTAKEILCDTGSGSVTLGLLSDVDVIDVDTGSGSVTIRIPEGFGAELELESGSGGIDLGVEAEATRIRRNYFRGVVGDGDGRVFIETGSGGIDIVRN